MIIGIDATRANFEVKTGIEWYAWHLIENLKKINISDQAGESVQFVLYSNKPLTGDLAKLPKNWQSKVLHWAPGRLWTQVRLSFEMLINPPDVLFVPSHVFPIIHPKKTVMTVHDVAAMRFPDAYTGFQKWYTLWAAKFAVKHLWKIIVPSVFTKRELLTLRGLNSSKENNIQIVYHGIDKSFKKVTNATKIEQIFTKYNLKNKYFLSIGRLEYKKNTHRIIAAFNEFCDKSKTEKYDLVLIGSSGYGETKIEKIIQDSSYSDRIIKLGTVAQEDMVYLLNAASIFVYPSLYEGFGLPILEAMSCGVPVIASTGSCLEEIGQDACLFVDPENVSSIADGMTVLIHDQDLRQQKIERGLVVIKKYAWEKCASETLKLLIR